MDFFDLFQQRYSIRAYKPVMREDGKLQQVPGAARLAPTAANRQAFQLIVIHTAGCQAELKWRYRCEWFSQAPLVIGMCALLAPAWERKDGKKLVFLQTRTCMPEHNGPSPLDQQVALNQSPIIWHAICSIAGGHKGDTSFLMLPASTIAILNV
jgi:nitroreductase